MNSSNIYNAGGNVGIGTASPSVLLDVENGTTSPAFKLVDGTQGAGMVLTSDPNGNASWQPSGLPAGNNTGDMLYWNGSAWVTVPVGTPGQYLQLTAANVPAWTLGLPAVTTTSPVSLTLTTATVGGNVTSNGGGSLTSYGVCWSTSANPTTSSSTTNDGSGNFTGTYSHTLTGLTTGTTYYVRAYATNNMGTVYGNQYILVAGLGASYQGGLIGYFLQPADAGYDVNTPHGLIVSTVDINTNVKWSNTYSNTGATSSAIGAGQANSSDIVTNQGTGTYAARLCTTYGGGGYSDWYLPSLNELNQLYLNRSLLGISTFNYWSSTEFNIDYAWVEYFSNGVQTHSVGDKTGDTYRIRAVRSF